MGKFKEVWKVCGYDKLKPAMQYALITNDEKIVATNAHMLVVIDMDDYGDFFEGASFAGDRLIHKDRLKLFSGPKVDKVIFHEKGYNILDKSGKVLDEFFFETTTAWPHDKAPQGAYKLLGSKKKEFLIFPDWRSVIPTHSDKESVNTIGINAEYLYTVQKAIDSENTCLVSKLTFYKKRKTIKVERGFDIDFRNSDSETFGLIMENFIESKGRKKRRP